jgi:hypothetical protein
MSGLEGMMQVVRRDQRGDPRQLLPQQLASDCSRRSGTCRLLISCTAARRDRSLTESE